MNYNPTMIHNLVQCTEMDDISIRRQAQIERKIQADRIDTFKSLREFGIPSSHAKRVFE